MEDDSIAESRTPVTTPFIGLLLHCLGQGLCPLTRASPVCRIRAFPVFSSTSSVLLKMKPIKARGFGNKFQAEKLARYVVSGQNQAQSQDIRAIWLPPCVSSGRSCGFYGIRDQFRSPTGAMVTEPRKTGLASTRVYTHRSRAREHEAFQFAISFQFIYIHSVTLGSRSRYVIPQMETLMLREAK